jgi:DtxR family transcriptional regulator, Mn-dependent transcriptional regulator
LQNTNKIALSELPLNQPAQVSRVANKSGEMLELLGEKHIRIGTTIEIRKRFVFDHSLQVKIGAAKIETISEQLAKNIFVKI